MIGLIQRHLEAIYAIEGPDVREFLVDAEAVGQVAGGLRPNREWVLVREEEEEVAIAVYVQAEDLAAVEGRSPAEAVSDALGAFCAITEAVSHFLLLVRRAARAERVSLLELEAQAEVDKYVTARLHGAPGPELRRRLFRDAALATDLSPDERARYAEAGRLADRYCTSLERLPHVDATLDELRRFYRLPPAARLDRLRRAA